MGINKSIKDAFVMIVANIFLLYILLLDAINYRFAIADGWVKNIFGVFFTLVLLNSMLEGDYNFFNKKIERKEIYLMFIKSPSFCLWLVMIFYVLSADLWAPYISFQFFVIVYIFFSLSLFYFQDKLIEKFEKIKNEKISEISNSKSKKEKKSK